MKIRKESFENNWSMIKENNSMRGEGNEKFIGLKRKKKKFLKSLKLWKTPENNILEKKLYIYIWIVFFKKH